MNKYRFILNYFFDLGTVHIDSFTFRQGGSTSAAFSSIVQLEMLKSGKKNSISFAEVSGESESTGD